MNPPTPTTSFTWMVNARIPAGTLRDIIPAVLSAGTSFDSMMGSPATNSRRATLPRTIFGSLMASFGRFSFGHGMTVTWFVLIVDARGMSTMATTIPAVWSLACSAMRPRSERNL